MESATKACQGGTQSQRAAATRYGKPWDWENLQKGHILHAPLSWEDVLCFFGTPEDFDSSSWYSACELQVCADLTRDNCGYARMDIPQNGWWRLRKSPMFLKAQFSFVKFPFSSLQCPDVHRLNSHPHLLNIGISRVCCLLYRPACQKIILQALLPRLPQHSPLCKRLTRRKQRKGRKRRKPVLRPLPMPPAFPLWPQRSRWAKDGLAEQILIL